MDRLQRSRTGAGGRYARLLDRLWKPKRHRRSTDISLTALTSPVPEPEFPQLSPAEGFSWLDLGSVSNCVQRGPVPLQSVADNVSYPAYGQYVPALDGDIWYLPMDPTLMF
jgi:hypothetical protein